MAVTELGIVVLLRPPTNLFVDVSIIALQLSRESYLTLFLSTTTEESPEQPMKVLSPMEVAEFGITTEVSPEQPEKALLGIIVTLSPIVNSLRFVQPLKGEFISVHFSALNITEVRPEQPEKASPPMEVTEYVAPLYAIVLGITTSPLWLPFATPAVLSVELRL